MKQVKRLLSLLLCICILSAGLSLTSTAAGWYTQIGDVRFAGGHFLEAVDFSAMISDRATITDKTLHLNRVYDEGTPYESYDRVANFVFSDSRVGVAELDDYPGAEAKIDPGVYRLEAVDGNLFDDVPFYTFSAVEYYQNASPAAGGLRPNQVGLPAFSDYTVTKAQGETVYEIQMTLSDDLAAFYDAVNPEGEVRILCKYSYAMEDVFASIDARPAAYDADTGLLTIELLDSEGNAGATMFNFRSDDTQRGFIFEFEFFSGLFLCGKVKSAYSYCQLAGSSIRNLPERMFGTDTAAGRMFYRLAGACTSEKRVKRIFAFTAWIALLPVFWVRFGTELVRAVRAYDGNTADVTLEQIRQMLREIYGVS